MSIRIDYDSLRKNHQAEPPISEELLKKAKGMFGRGARKQLVRLFDQQIRLLAAEIAQREADPSTLYEAGTKGVLAALDIYTIGRDNQSFRSFALPLIRQEMQRAKQGRA